MVAVYSGSASGGDSGSHRGSGTAAEAGAESVAEQYAKTLKKWRARKNAHEIKNETHAVHTLPHVKNFRLAQNTVSLKWCHVL